MTTISSLLETPGANTPNPLLSSLASRNYLYLALSILSLGILPAANKGIHKMIVQEILPATKKKGEVLQTTTPQDFQQIELETVDKIKLKAHLFFSSEATDTENDTWMIFLNGNAMTYESNADLYAYTARMRTQNGNKNYHALLFNGRGINGNPGFPWAFDDLVKDGEAAVQYLLDAGIPASKVELWGFSMGGAVAAYVAAKTPAIKTVNLCSFAKLSNVAAYHLIRLAEKAPPLIKTPLLAVANRIDKILNHYNWNPHPAEIWPKIESERKLIVHNEFDPLIPAECSLAHAVLESDHNVQKKDIHFMNIQDVHTYPNTEGRLHHVFEAVARAFESTEV